MTCACRALFGCAVVGRRLREVVAVEPSCIVTVDYA